MTVSYNTVAIRELLGVYSDEELRILCFDYFSDVFQQFAEGMSRTMKVQRLLEYAVAHDAVRLLLEQARRQNPSRYEEFEPRLVTPDWLASATGAASQRTSTITAEEKTLRPPRAWEPSAPPREIRLNLEGIRRAVEGLSANVELFSRAEEVLNVVPHLQRTIETQINICASAAWDSARHGQEGLIATCEDLSLRAATLLDRLDTPRTGLRPSTQERIKKLKMAQDATDAMKEQLRDECDQITRVADVLAGAAPQPEWRGQVRDHLLLLNREVGHIAAATVAIRKDLYDEIRDCVTQLTRLIPTDKEA
jgi:hypothetical protein